MKDVLDSLNAWRRDGEEIALATVVSTWGSAPRPVGSKLACTRSGRIAGSVSAGCVESAVLEEGADALKTGRPRLVTYGVADEDAWDVGLACGGTIRVLVEPLRAWDGIYGSLARRLAAGEPLAVVSVLAGPDALLNRKLIVLPDGTTEGDLDPPGGREAVAQAALEALAQEAGRDLSLADGLTLFIEVYPPTPRLIIIGAVHIAGYLDPLARTLGFETILVDPRSAFNTPERFPDVSRRVLEWPGKALPALGLDRWAYVVVLTHDPKLDDPALQIALRSEARYVGALGSRRTARLRADRLRRAGLSEAQIGRLHAPIGLPLGGQSPAEIALSILAEIVQVRSSARPEPATP